MSPSHRDHRSRGTLGTALLACVCCAGAVAYGVIVGPSMLPPQDVQATTAMTPDLAPDPEEPEQTVERGPTGQLRIQVSDRDRAWVQTLLCTGDLEKDPAACAELAQAAEEFHADTGNPVTGAEEAYSEGGGEPSKADAAGAEELFTEVREGTVCTDEMYGPQEATIEGTWEGEEVETTLSRQGSCEEARWQRLRPLTEQIG